MDETTNKDAVIEMGKKWVARCIRTNRLRKLVRRCRCWHEEEPDYTPGGGHPGSPSCLDLVAFWEGRPGNAETTVCSRCARRPRLEKALASAKAAERNTRRGLVARIAKL